MTIFKETVQTRSPPSDTRFTYLPLQHLADSGIVKACPTATHYRVLNVTLAVNAVDKTAQVTVACGNSTGRNMTQSTGYGLFTRFLSTMASRRKGPVGGPVSHCFNIPNPIWIECGSSDVDEAPAVVWGATAPGDLGGDMYCTRTLDVEYILGVALVSLDPKE